MRWEVNQCNFAVGYSALGEGESVEKITRKDMKT